MIGRRVVVNSKVVAEHEGGNVVIRFRDGAHMRTYVLTPAPGTRLTATVRGVTEEVPMPPLLAVVAA